MIQDIFPSVFDNHFKNLYPCDGDIAFFFSDKGVLCHYEKVEKKIRFPLWKDFSDSADDVSGDVKTIFLFYIDEKKYFLVLSDKEITFPEGYSLCSMKEIRRLDLASNNDIFAAFSAFHLWTWYKQSKFCGSCGELNIFGENERSMVCPKCGNTIYPRINPAVIIGITNGDRILITKYRTGYAHSALVAGFTEFGETLEETVEREVREEVGLKVKNIRYYKSQPWGIALDILVGFFCEVDGDDKIKMDENELKYAEWVNREDIELQPSDYSLTNEMMKLFKSGKFRDWKNK